MANPFLTPAKIISGKDALDAAGPALAALGKKALIVTDAMMIKLGNLDKVLKVLNQHHIAYSIDAEINSEPCDTMIVHGLKQYQAEHCDFLIALGGGSPIDSMKAIAMMSTDPDRPLNSYMGQPVETPLPKKVAIPTTAGTGSEATQFTIITDTENDVKMLLKGGSLIPDLAIIDPQFTMTAPKGVTSATGIDALCHAIEAYTSRLAQPLSEKSRRQQLQGQLRAGFGQLTQVFQQRGLGPVRRKVGLNCQSFRQARRGEILARQTGEVEDADAGQALLGKLELPRLLS